MGLPELAVVIRRTVTFGLCLSVVLVMTVPVNAQIQTGKDREGTLWLSDQGLPVGVQPATLELDQVMSLPPEQTLKDTPRSSRGEPVTRSPVTLQKMSPAEITTCNGVDQRYEETRINLENIERDKASGKLLIPDSGLVTFRQNLDSLARLKALCTTLPAR